MHFPDGSKLAASSLKIVMYTLSTNNPADEEMDMDESEDMSTTNDAVEDDGTPVLDEEDLEENDLDEDEAEDLEWEEPTESAS